MKTSKTKKAMKKAKTKKPLKKKTIKKSSGKKVSANAFDYSPLKHDSDIRMERTNDELHSNIDRLLVETSQEIVETPCCGHNEHDCCSGKEKKSLWCKVKKFFSKMLCGGCCH